MQAFSYPQVVSRRRVDPRKVPCTMCEHNEFVHGDNEPRRCLYAECACDGFTPEVVVPVDGGEDLLD